MHVGFTGSRKGMTAAQQAEVAKVLTEVGATVVHHGDCLGSDAAVHALAVARRLETVIHPPEDTRYRAFCRGNRTMVPKPYLDRNLDIVLQSALLVATPDGPERVRSGTWATVRRAIDAGRQVYVILPTGVRVVTHP